MMLRFNNQLELVSDGKYVLYEEVEATCQDYLNKIEAIDRRHREVRDAIAEERDAYKERLIVISDKLHEIRLTLITLRDAISELKSKEKLG